MFLMAQGMKKQYSAVWPVILGANNAYLISIIVFTMGLSQLLQKNIIILKSVQLTGVIYLLYLAYAQWVKDFIHMDDCLSVTKNESSELYKKGVLIALSNPKTILLFSVIFPQFIVANQSRIYQVAIFGITFLVLQASSGWSYAYFGSRVKGLFNKPEYQLLIHRLSALVLVAIALLLLSKL